MARSTAMACFAPAPMGTACRRTSSGESTTRTSGSSRCSSSAFQVPWSSSVSPTASTVSFGPWSSPRRCTARMMRSPLSVTIPGNTGLPDQAGSGRDDDLGQTGRAVEQRVRDIAGRILRPEGEDLVGGQTGGRFRVAAHDEDVAVGEGAPPQRAAAVSGLDADQGQPGVLLQVDRGPRRPHVRRPGPHAELEEPVVEPVLLDERPGVPAEVGRHRPAAPVRQQALARTAR